MPLMSWVVEVKGVGLSDPIRRTRARKSRPQPRRCTRVAMATPLPSGIGISRESTESMRLGERWVSELLETKELCHQSGFGRRGRRKERLGNRASGLFGLRVAPPAPPRVRTCGNISFARRHRHSAGCDL